MRQFERSFTEQQPLPPEAIEAAMRVMQSGNLHRYTKHSGELNEVDLLELEFRQYMGTRFALAVNSCGFALQIALRSTGVGTGTPILCNSFTLAPVPGAIENCGATCVLVETSSDLTVDIDDLQRQAEESKAKHFLISHMRGHLANMDAVAELCNALGIIMIEDCAHTMGATWNGKRSGTFGAIGCFSTQTYKHMNSGEGGLIISDNTDYIARCVLMSGSYMLYGEHLAAPEPQAYEDLIWTTPNFSGRMDNLRAAVLRPQLARLDDTIHQWNSVYRQIEAGMQKIPGIRLVSRDPREGFVGSSIQFFVPAFSENMMAQLVRACGQSGVTISWFGAKMPHKYTSRHESWRYIAGPRDLPKTDRVLHKLCDMRLPVSFSFEDCDAITDIIGRHVNRIAGSASA